MGWLQKYKLFDWAEAHEQENEGMMFVDASEFERKLNEIRDKKSRHEKEK